MDFDERNLYCKILKDVDCVVEYLFIIDEEQTYELSDIRSYFNFYLEIARSRFIKEFSVPTLFDKISAVGDASISIFLNALIVIILLILVGFNRHSIKYILLIYEEKENDALKTKIGKAFVNSTVFIGVSILVTTIFLILTKINRIKYLKAFLIFAHVFILIYTGYVVFINIIVGRNIPFDWITFSIILWNLMIAAPIYMFYTTIHQTITRIHAHIASVFISTYLALYPTFTLFILVIVFSIYDLLAVVLPYGLLRSILSNELKNKNDLSGLMLESSNFSVTSKKKGKYTIKLGTGDFIIYSAFVGGIFSINIVASIAVLISIMVGLIVTVWYLEIKEGFPALPALPIPILFGIIVFFASYYLLTPMIIESSKADVVF